MPSSLEAITHPDLAPLRHGFFTRKGGASSGVFAGLNCGAGSSDQRAAIATNRARVAGALGADELVGVHQVHSSDVVHATVPLEPKPKADALVTATPGLALSVLTADCQPVLFADTKAGVIGAAHAGWRGALGGVLEATLDAMEKLGASRGDTVAIIGPSISQNAYEVGPEFVSDFSKQCPENERFFRSGVGDRMQFDLPGYGMHRLQAAGVKRAAWTGHCTYSDEERFFSYRRSTHRKEADYGRLISAIVLPG